MTPDPPRRPDNLCARPGCERELKPPAAKQKGVDPRQYASEPFCSATCCRIYHGLPTTQQGVGRPREAA